MSTTFMQQAPIVPVMTSLALEEVSNPLLGKTHQQSQRTLFLICPYWKQSQLPTTLPTAKAIQLINFTGISSIVTYYLIDPSPKWWPKIQIS